MQETETYVTGIGIVFLGTMALLTWVLPRRLALIPLLITTCYMPLGQMFIIGGLHFQFFRILLLVGWSRVFMRQESSALKLGRLDKVFIWWALVTLVIGTLTQPSFDRFINRSGEVYNAIGTFFLMRCWIRELEDVIRLIRWLAWIIFPLAVLMIVEKFTSRNVFSVFGGVSEITAERDGKLRCQGAFRHPILAGTYAATMFPLFVGIWFQKGKNKWPAIVGGSSAIIATLAAQSSGAFLALLVEVFSFGLWPLRDRMRLFRRGAVVSIVLLHLLMKAPVWFLIARMSDVVGGSGWYRSNIIDQAINHLGEWWLVGTRYTAHWSPGGETVPGNPGNMDIINHYVSEGVDGGLLKLGLFVALIVTCFKIIGRWTNPKNLLPFPQAIFAWSLGVALLGHCTSFFSVVYFDQIIVMWFWLLACICVLTPTMKIAFAGGKRFQSSAEPMSERRSVLAGL
ncbi:MAG: hypothetical protein QOG67_3135 [Verrucomicrobiota bacterium]|jgi:hypothetical protein